METIQPIPQPPQPSSQNPCKILFFLSLGLFLIIASVLVTLLITQKSSKSIQTTDIEETEVTPIETIETEVEPITPIPTEITTTITKSIIPFNSSDKTFNVADLEFKIPENWSLVSIEKDIKNTKVISNYVYYQIKFLTDYKPYKVYALASIHINNTNKNDYICDWNPIKTQYGQVCEISGSGYGHFYINLNNGKNYYISWGIESNQSPPKDLDGLWSPDNNLTNEIMMDFCKSTKPIN